MQDEGFREADTCGGVEVGGDFIIGGADKHDLFKQEFQAEAAGAAVSGVLIIDEGVVSCLTEVSASDNELPEAEVERLKQAFPVVAAKKLIPCRLIL